MVSENRSEITKTLVQIPAARTKNTLVISLVYLLLLGITEGVIYNFNSLAGLVLHFLILLGLIIVGTLTRNEGRRRLWLALGLAPFMRIVSLVMPVAEISQVYWYILIAIPTIVAVIAVMRALKYNIDDLGLDLTDPVLQSLIAITGIFLGAIGYLILKPQPLIGQLIIQMALSPALVLMISTGFVEEIVFRGVMQRAAGVLGSWDWIYISLIYAVLQIGHGSWLFALLILGVSLFFGWMVKKTGSITGVCIAHGLFNIGLYLVFAYTLYL